MSHKRDGMSLSSAGRYRKIVADLLRGALSAQVPAPPPRRGERRPEFRRLLEHPTAPLVREISPADAMFNDGAPENYFVYGTAALAWIEQAMVGVGKQTLTNILDLPSGYGRVLRTLHAAFPDAQLTARDIDCQAVDFCAATFDARPVYSSDDFSKVRLDGGYDLIWVWSLLTHLSAAR